MNHNTGSHLTASWSSRLDAVTEGTLDAVIQNFVEFRRDIPDVGMRTFEYDTSVNDDDEMFRAQNMFALYVLGKVTPGFNFWEGRRVWESHGPS